MKTHKKRLCIYPKDIQRITGKSYRQSLRLFNKIRIELRKNENEFLSIDDFCSYTSLDYEKVMQLIVD